MICEKTVNQLWSRLEEPGRALDEDCQTHLQVCEACQTADREVGVLLHALARHETFRAPAGFADAVMLSIGVWERKRVASRRIGVFAIGGLAIVATAIVWITLGPSGLSEVVTASGSGIADYAGPAEGWLATQWNALTQSFAEFAGPLRPVGKLVTPLIAMILGCAAGGMSLVVLFSLGAMRRRTVAAPFSGSVLI